MAITAYSRTFQREVQVSQLEDLHRIFANELKLNSDFRLFVSEDVECPCCNVSNAIVVKEGYSSKTAKLVKLAHFSFRNKDGFDSHLKFCDYYQGHDKEKQTTNDCNISIRDSNNVTTEAIRKLICAGIENKTLSQDDIRNMRQWFLTTRSKPDLFIEDSKIILNIVYEALYNVYRKRNRYVEDISKLDDPFFDLDNETYKSLSFKLPIEKLPDSNEQVFYCLTRKTTLRRAINISLKDNGTYTFDRTNLEDKYKATFHLSYKIIQTIPEISDKFRDVNKIKRNNVVMAYSALLLFICNWDYEIAYSKHIEISKITHIQDHNLGNVIGINPFLDYDAWRVLKFINEWKVNLKDYNLQDEFERERDRLEQLYSQYLEDE